jgi:tRNA(Ile)-lysidine synthase
LLDQIAGTISRYNMFAAGGRVGVAVSGGVDSVCLLHTLRELASRWGLALEVLHVNHRLRGAASDEDARFVERLAGELGLPFHLRALDVGAIAGNLEQAARNVRREFFREAIAELGLTKVATGHTRTDQAETVLFRLLRGAGNAGLAGVLPVTREGLVRPLLEVDRQAVEEWLRGRGIGWREDASNADERFSRNRIRHELLPKLRAEWNPSIDAMLAQMSQLAREDEAYWREVLPEHLLVRRAGTVLLNVDAVRKYPVAVVRRLLRRAMEMVRGDLQQIEFRHIDAALALVDEKEGHGRVQIPGADVFRSMDWLRMAPQGVDNLIERNFRIPLEIPCVVTSPGLGVCICIERMPEESRYTDREHGLDGDKMTGQLDLRNWRPGDQYRRVPGKEAEKVKILFQEARVPLWDRRFWPIITMNDEIVWAWQFGPAAEFMAGVECGNILRIKPLTPA